MSPEDFYRHQISNLTEQIAKAYKTERLLSVSRLVAFVASLVVLYLVSKFGVLLSILAFTVSLSGFGFILNKHLSVQRLRQRLEALLVIQQNELEALNGNFSKFPQGVEFQNHNHPYISDLDIFGQSSLFQFLNRTTTLPGNQKLAQWLSTKASVDEIKLRQNAVAELSGKSEWRQQFLVAGALSKGSMDTPERILDWVGEERTRFQSTPLFIGLFILSSISIALLIIGAPVGIISISLIINAVMYYTYFQHINQVHRTVGRTSDLLSAYQLSIKLIETEEFKTDKLNQIKKVFDKDSQTASKRLHSLSKLVKRLNYRLNISVGIPLNLFLFWDLWHVRLLEQWRISNRDLVHSWFDSMAQFEALSSLATLSFNHPKWVFPKIAPYQFVFNAHQLGHPLIPQNRRVVNDFSMSGPSKIVLITGSNMSGKSTFQRTMGVNLVLAMAGSVVCAENFETSHVTPFTSMRIVDSLEDNTSSFYAELKRLAQIIKATEQGDDVFLLLDEILRGTNSNDRHIGSAALIRQLIAHKAVGVLATHDLSLSEMVHELPQNIDNYNFDVKIVDDELYFDYKLNRGICKSLNASILMRKMGINL